MSDRIAVMNEGRIEQIGSPQDVYERPATRFVAGFIGVSNLLSSTVVAVDGDELHLDAHPGDRLVVPTVGGRGEGDPVTFTIRPEKLTLGDAPDADACRLAVTVVNLVYQGTATSYTLRTHSGDEVIAFAPNTGADLLAPGRETWLTWRPEQGAVIPEPPATASSTPPAAIGDVSRRTP